MRERDSKRQKPTRALAFMSIALALLSAKSSIAAPRSGFTVELKNSAVVVTSPAGAEVLTLKPRTLIYQVGEQGAKERYGTFEVTEGPASLTCTFGEWTGQVAEGKEHRFVGSFKQPGCPDSIYLSLKVASARRLEFQWTTESVSAGRERLSFEIGTSSDENFLGLGAQYTHLKLKGHKVPILAQEQGHGRGIQPISFLQSLFTPGLQGTPYSTYSPSSFFMSTKGRAFFFPQYEYGEVNFSKPRAIGVKYWSPSVKGEVYLDDTPAKLIAAHTARIGRQSAPPDWAHQGAIIGVMGGSEKVRSLQQELESRGAPIAAWWLQDWVGSRPATLATRLNWNWQLDDLTYPDWKDLVSEMHSRGERVLSYVNPYISPDAIIRPPQRNLYQEALERSYLVLHEDGTPYTVEMGGFKACLIDLFNPEARKWLKDVMLAQSMDHKISGWMADFGEAFPFDGSAHTEFPQEELHHRYIEEWSKLNHEIVQENSSDELFIFQRAGFHFSQRYSSMFWLGDQSTTWDGMDGMKSALNGMLSSGISGWQFNHSDIGGYFSVRIPALVRISRSPQLFIRWAEMNAFTPLFRTHEGLNPELNFQFYSAPWAYDIFVKFARVFADFFPYRKQVFEEAERTGLPAVRHLYINYPEDPNTLSVEDQFMLGEDVMVAPIFKNAVAQRRVYLPKGTWTHLWTATTFQMKEGGWVHAKAPLGQPPVYINPDNQVLKALADKYQAQSLLQE